MGAILWIDSTGATPGEFRTSIVERLPQGTLFLWSAAPQFLNTFLPRSATDRAAMEGDFTKKKGDMDVPFGALPKALLRALVVDPDAEYRRFLHGLLEPHGFEVHQASNGEEGFIAALARRPWLILTDVNMPGMDGFELCRRVRRHNLIRHTPLVFLSAWDDYGARYHGLKLGAHEYLSKGLPPREVLIRLQLVLKRYSDVGPTLRGAHVEGRIEVIGAAGMLQVCHLGRFSGVCTTRSGMLRIQLRFRDGEIVGANSNTARGAEAVYELLSWDRGHFDLLPSDPGEKRPPLGALDYLVLEGCRRLDERRRAV